MAGSAGQWLPRAAAEKLCLSKLVVQPARRPLSLHCRVLVRNTLSRVLACPAPFLLAHCPARRPHTNGRKRLREEEVAKILQEEIIFYSSDPPHCVDSVLPCKLSRVTTDQQETLSFLPASDMNAPASLVVREELLTVVNDDAVVPDLDWETSQAEEMLTRLLGDTQDWTVSLDKDLEEMDVDWSEDRTVTAMLATTPVIPAG